MQQILERQRRASIRARGSALIYEHERVNGATYLPGPPVTTPPLSQPSVHASGFHSCATERHESGTRVIRTSLSPSLGPLDAWYLDAAREEARLHRKREVVARFLPVADDRRHISSVLAQAHDLGTHLRPQRIEVELRLVAWLGLGLGLGSESVSG